MLYDKLSYNIFSSNIPEVAFDSLPAESQNKVIEQYLQAVNQESHTDSSGNTIVHEIIHQHSDKLFRIVFRDGCPLLNTPNAAGNTPLLDAIISDDERLLVELLKRDVSESINYPNKKGITPLLVAVSKGNLRQVKLLLKHGARLLVDLPEGSNFISPLHLAAMLEDSAVFKLLLKHGAEDLIAQKDFRGLTPFQRAIISKRVETVKLMLEVMPELANTLNEPDSFGITHLQRAARSGKEMMSLLLAHCNEKELKVNPKISFLAEDLNDCIVDGVDPQNIPIDQVAFPLTVAQNFCNVMVRLKDGNILKISNADGKQVRKILLEKKFGAHEEKYNVLTMFLNPNHGFLRLECDNCNEGKSYNENRGFYPLHGTCIVGSMAGKTISVAGEVLYGTYSYIPPTIISAGLEVAFFPFSKRHGVIGNEDESELHSDVANELKIEFYVDDRQAKAALKTIQEAATSCSGDYYASCIFSPVGDNCIDFMQRVFKNAGGHGDFASYLNDRHLRHERTHSYAFIRSRGLESYFDLHGYGPMAQQIYQTIAPVMPSKLSYFTSSKSIQPIHNALVLKPSVDQGASEEESDAGHDVSQAYHFNLSESIMLGAVLVKVATDTYHFAIDVWGKVVGEKATPKERSDWLSDQNKKFQLLMNKLEYIGNKIDSLLMIRDYMGSILEEDVSQSRSEYKQLWDEYIDLQFDGFELEKEMNDIRRSGTLPTKNHLAKLEKRIAKLLEDTTDLAKRLEES